MSSGEAPEDPSTEATPAKKRKKKRKSAPQADAPGGRVEREGAPTFARKFPDHPALNALVDAFEAGNYAGVREGAKKLLDDTARAEKGASGEGEREAVRRAARELLQRIDPDPIAIYMLAGSFLLLCFLAFWYWSHPHVP